MNRNLNLWIFGQLFLKAVIFQSVHLLIVNILMNKKLCLGFDK